MNYYFNEFPYRPNHYDFTTAGCAEWYPNGYFVYNITRLRKDSQNGVLDPYLRDVSVDECIRYVGEDSLPDTYVDEADLERPILIAEVSPASYNIIDGYHRLAKARTNGARTLKAYCIPAETALQYLSGEEQYVSYVEYWNSKVHDYGNTPGYRGIFYPVEPRLKERKTDGSLVWKSLENSLAECRRIEIVCNYERITWMSVFRLNGKIFCGEAEAHPSISCAQPFRISEEQLQEAIPLFQEWLAGYHQGRTIRPAGLRHADAIMAVIRVFSQEE